MAFGIDVKGMTAKLDARFAEMMGELKAMRNVLMQILAQLQKEDQQSLTSRQATGDPNA